MNDQRFNELLNLHLDHETTPAQAAEFEAELNRTPARRREYAAYCRMHHACAHHIERERSLAPASFALEKARLDAERTAAATARPAVRRPLVTAFAGFAAMAACLALVFTRLSPEPSSAHGQPGPTGSTVASTATPASAAPAAGAAYQASSLATTVPVASVGLARVDLPEFTPQMDLPPLQPVMVEDFVVQPRLTVQQIMAISRSTGTQPPTAQTAAFQFQR